MPRGIPKLKIDVPQGTDEKTQEIEMSTPERKYSDEKDRKGQGHPLCHACGHREDMHHSWREVHVIRQTKDGEVKEVQKEKVFDSLPCQHACKCTGYK